MVRDTGELYFCNSTSNLKDPEVIFYVFYVKD